MLDNLIFRLMGVISALKTSFQAQLHIHHRVINCCACSLFDLFFSILSFFSFFLKPLPNMGQLTSPLKSFFSYAKNAWLRVRCFLVDKSVTRHHYQHFGKQWVEVYFEKKHSNQFETKLTCLKRTIMTIICSSAKVVLYDERPKMMRGTRQRKVFFDRKGLLFCRVSLFIFGRSSNVMA